MSQVSYGTITITDMNDIEEIYTIYAGSNTEASPTFTYAAVTDGTTWKRNASALSGFKYIWQSTVVTKSGITINSTNWQEFYGQPVRLTGLEGDDARNITDITPYYYLSTSDSSQTGGSWSTTPQAYPSTGTAYYWTKTITTYDSGSPTESTAVLDMFLTNAAKDARDANTNAAIANSIAQHANENAQGAMSQAAAAQQLATQVDTLLGGHFMWHGSALSTNTKAGARVVEQIKENGTDVSSNPAKWHHNVNIGADGIQLRYNEAIMAQLAANQSSGNTALKFYRPPTISGSTTEQGALAMELTGDALNFYGGNNNLSLAKFTSSGISLTPLGDTVNGLFIEVQSNNTIGMVLSEAKNNSTLFRTAHASNMSFAIGNDVAYPQTQQSYTTIDGETAIINSGVMVNYIDTGATGKYSLAQGRGAIVEGDYSTAFGEGVYAIGDCQIVLGRWNKADSDAYLIIGNGQTGETVSPEGVITDNRSNIFVVNGDGNLEVKDGFKIISDENSELILSSNGIDIKQNNISLASFAATGAQIGQSEAAHSVIDANGQRFYAADGTTQLANIGYGEGAAQSGMETAPYYTFGVRKTTTTAYSSSSTYIVGDMCVYGKKVYVCIYNITTPESWNSSHWKYYIGNNSMAEGINTIASGYDSHAEGAATIAIGSYSHAEGDYTTASGMQSHAEGEYTTASGYDSHAEGFSTKARGNYSHAEGYSTIASEDYSHAEGYYTTASGSYSHAEGSLTTASSNYAHAEGGGTIASGYASHAEGVNTIASGLQSHAQNSGTVATEGNQTVIGKYNSATRDGRGTSDDPYTYTNAGDYAFIIGNGTGGSTALRSNALTVDWQGRVECGNYNGNLSSIFDIFYPVGSYYETSLPYTVNGHSYDSNNLTDEEKASCGSTWFDPRVAWGGTWKLEIAGMVHVSAGTGYAVSGANSADGAGAKDGGNTTSATGNHTLTTAEIPAHTHKLGSSVVRYINKTAIVAKGTNYKFFSEDSNLYTDSNTGGGGSHNHGNVSTMQPYINVYRWHRTA